MLDCLDRCDIEYAILHGADRVDSQSVVSDIDVVVGVSPPEVIRRVSRCLESAGLVPVMEWPYDVAQTRTVFLATVDGGDAVQLDMLHDRWGLGKYAVKSDALLQRSARTNGRPVLAPVDELVYLIRKRTVKRDATALAALRARMSEVPARDLEVSIRSTLSSSGRRSVRAFVAGVERARALRPLNGLSDLVRRVRRLFRPTGFWVHCADEQTAEFLCTRFATYLPNVVRSGSVSRLTQVPILLWRRLKPGVVVTHGARHRLFSPDVVVEGLSPDEAIRTAVAEFRDRTERRLGEK